MSHRTIHPEQIQATGSGTQGLEETGQKHVCLFGKIETQAEKADGKIPEDQTQVQKAVVKLFLSHVLYHVGDVISRTTMRYGYGYPVYNRIMLWSVDLDPQGKLWKKVKPPKKNKKRR